MNVHVSERARLDALDRYRVLDTPREQSFDDIAALAADICGAPIAVVNLVTDDRQWFKAEIGLGVDGTPLETSFCVHALLEDDFLLVPDATQDPRFACNPLVTGDPGIGFYAGALLKTADGHAIGTLCVLDLKPRTLDQWQQDALVRLSRQVMAQLDLRLALIDRDHALAAERSHADALSENEQRLATSEAHWRGLFENLSEGFLIGEVIRADDGTVSDWRYAVVNHALGSMLGFDPADVLGRTVREVIPDVETAWIDELARVVETGAPISFSRQLGVHDRWYEGRAFAAGGDRFAVIFIDTTDRRNAEERQAALLALGDRLRDGRSVSEMTVFASKLVGETLGACRAGFGRIDQDTESVDIQLDWTDGTAASVAGRHRFADYGKLLDDLAEGNPLIIDDVRTDERTRSDPTRLLDLGIGSLLNMPVRQHGETVAMFFVHDDRPRKWTEDEFGFLRDVADRVTVHVARIDAEKQQAILNRELSHRLKNTLSMVQAIASQTLKPVNDRAPVDAFDNRLAALAGAHDILLRRQFVSAGLYAVCDSVLGAVSQVDRVRLDGPDLRLGSRATLSFSLLLNELATNAAKYGSLSVDTGHVELSWRIDDVDGRPSIEMRWTERGGPPAQVPARRGFGTRLIKMGLIGTGGVDLCYDHSGFSAVMRAPLVELQEA